MINMDQQSMNSLATQQQSMMLGMGAQQSPLYGLGGIGAVGHVRGLHQSDFDELKYDFDKHMKECDELINLSLSCYSTS